MLARTPQRQVEDHMSELRGAMPGELAGHFATAMLAKKSFDTTKQVDTPFPEDYFVGTRAIDDEGRRVLEAYEKKLQVFREQLIAHNSLFTHSVARGVSIWITTIHTLVHDDLRKDGLDLWERLMRSEQNLEEAYRLLVRREVTDVELAYLKFRPTVLMPTGPAKPRMPLEPPAS